MLNGNYRTEITQPYTHKIKTTQNKNFDKAEKSVKNLTDLKNYHKLTSLKEESDLEFEPRGWYWGSEVIYHRILAEN